MWFWWTLIALTALGAVLTVAWINEPRIPITRFDACIRVVTSGLIIWGIAYYGLMR